MEMTREIFYRRPLTEAQLLEFADEAGALQGKIDREKEEIKEYCRERRIQLKEWESRLTEICGYLRTKRGESEQVTVREVYDDPEPGKKSIYDAETGERYETLDMTDEEKESLFAQGKADPATEPDPEPEAETSPEPGATPETAIELEECEENAFDEEGGATLEEGKFYRYKNRIYRTTGPEEPYNSCKGCAFRSAEIKCPRCHCDVNDLILVPDDLSDADPSPAETPELPLEEASAAEVRTDPGTPVRICSHCGAVRSGIRVYMMPNGRYYCENCLAEKRLKGLAKLNEKWEALKRAGKNPLLFRAHPVWSNGANPELVEFKFATGKNGAWENPIYFPGGPDDEQTEAGKYREMLIAAGAREG